MKPVECDFSSLLTQVSDTDCYGVQQTTTFQMPAKGKLKKTCQTEATKGACTLASCKFPHKSVANTSTQNKSGAASAAVKSKAPVPATANSGAAAAASKSAVAGVSAAAGGSAAGDGDSKRESKESKQAVSQPKASASGGSGGAAKSSAVEDDSDDSDGSDDSDSDDSDGSDESSDDDSAGAPVDQKQASAASKGAKPVQPKPQLCVNCREPFVLTAKKEAWFKMKGYHLPKRCESCRKQRKYPAGSISRVPESVMAAGSFPRVQAGTEPLKQACRKCNEWFPLSIEAQKKCADRNGRLPAYCTPCFKLNHRAAAKYMGKERIQPNSTIV